MRVVIDRFEGEFAVCEADEGNMINIEKSKLPEGAREGDVLEVTDDGISIASDATGRKKQDIEKLFRDLWTK